MHIHIYTKQRKKELWFQRVIKYIVWLFECRYKAYSSLVTYYSFFVVIYIDYSSTTISASHICDTADDRLDELRAILYITGKWNWVNSVKSEWNTRQILLKLPQTTSRPSRYHWGKEKRLPLQWPFCCRYFHRKTSNCVEPACECWDQQEKSGEFVWSQSTRWVGQTRGGRAVVMVLMFHSARGMIMKTDHDRYKSCWRLVLLVLMSVSET